MVFENEIPLIQEPEEKKQTIREEIVSVKLRYQFYDLNKQTKEWIELMDELGLIESSLEDLLMYFKKGDTVSNLEYIYQIPIDGIDEVKRNRIFYTQYLRLSIVVVSEKFFVPSNLIKKWIKEFIKNLKQRKSANRKYWINRSLWRMHTRHIC